jgi:hypothetical protein
MTKTAKKEFVAQLERGDFVRLQALLRRRAERAAGLASRIGPPLSAVLALTGAFLGARALGMTPLPALAIGALAGLGFALWAGARAQKRAFKRVLRDDGAVLRPFRFKADDAGVSIETDVTSARIAWAGVHSIGVEGAMLVLELDGASAVALPRRVFADHESMLRFADELQAMKETAAMAAPSKTKPGRAA